MGDQATDESRQIWDSVAAGWEKERAFINELERAVTERMHEALGVRPGDTILELCAGPGEVGLRLAPTLAPNNSTPVRRSRIGGCALPTRGPR
jgi:ubiquinone/menaquinone biosynthesis C-methylase UbiE